MSAVDYRLQVALVGIIVVLVILVPAAVSWTRRRRRDETRAPLPQLPVDIEDREPVGHVDGMYVATTRHGNTMDRLVGHGLGVRTRARAFLYEDGLLLDRTGAEPVWIAASRITDFGTGSGMVGKFVEPGGLVMVTWSHAGQSVDTGFRPQEAGGKPRLLEALAAFGGSSAQTSEAPGEGPSSASQNQETAP